MGEREQAEEIKAAANKLFKSGKYADAVEKYTEAINIDSGVAAYYCNRSLAHIKLENYGYAISDAEKAMEVDPKYIKPYYRRASAYLALSRFKESLKDFKTVVKYVPNDQDAKKQLNAVEKIVRKIDFEKALSYDHDVKLASETVNVDDMAVDSKYDGPVFEKDDDFDSKFIEQMIQRMENQKMIHRKYAYKIILKSLDIFKQMPSVVSVKLPKTENSKLTVCGDIHGQFYDLLNIFRKNGFPSANHTYIFNGDFVDRGSFSVEVILTLLAFKCLYPENFFMARGNHETDNMNRVYGFEGEVKAKYSEKMFQLFSELFNAMPLAHVIENRVFVVHGGLFSKDGVKLEELCQIDRFKQPPDGGMMCEMLWSDPTENSGRLPSKRGVALQFGADVTKRFLQENDLDLIIRSHEVRDEGYKIEHEGKLVTVFSAPNYCDQVGNKGAVVNITRKRKDQIDAFKPELDYDYWKFEAVPHPNVKAMQYASGAGMFGL